MSQEFKVGDKVELYQFGDFDGHRAKLHYGIWENADLVVERGVSSGYLKAYGKDKNGRERSVEAYAWRFRYTQMLERESEEL